MNNKVTANETFLLKFKALILDDLIAVLLPFQVKNTAIALEPQYWPDSPNHANFPSTTLRPGQRYSETIQFNFYQI